MLISVSALSASLFDLTQGVPDFFTEAVGLPPGLFMSRGEEWKQSRRTLAPAFSARNIRAVSLFRIFTFQFSIPSVANCMYSMCVYTDMLTVCVHSVCTGY